MIFMGRNVVKAVFMIVFLFVICACSNDSQAKPSDFYVSPTGSDSNPGTEDRPFKSIQKACNEALPGSTVYVHSGVYNEVVKINSSGSEDKGYITITNYPGENPVLDGSGLRVPADDYSGMFFIDSKSYIKISGFEIRNYKSDSPVAVPIGIHIHGSSSNIEIKNNKIHNIETGINGARVCDAHGIAVYGSSSVSSKNITIEGNEIYDCKLGSSESLTINGNVEDFKVINNYVHNNDNIGIAIIGWEDTARSDDQARNGVVRGNRISNICSKNNPAYEKECSSDGIYSDGGKDFVIENNIISNCDIGIEVASEHKGKSTSNVTVINNIIYNCHLTGIAFGGYDEKRGSTVNCRFLNNTLYNNDTTESGCGEVLVQHSTSGNIFTNNIIYAGKQNIFVTNDFTQNSGNVFDYNIYYSQKGAADSFWLWKRNEFDGFDEYRKKTGNDKNSKFADPLFVDLNTVAPDVHIKDGSPAINAGNAVDYVKFDFDGKVRKSGKTIDCGAYEFGGSSQDSKGNNSENQTKTYSLSGYISCDVKTQYADINKNIKVEILGTDMCAYTDINGYFKFDKVPFNDKGYSLRISKNNYLERKITDTKVVENVQLGSKTSPIGIWPGDVNMDGALTMSDIMHVVKVLNTTPKDSEYDIDRDLNFDSAINLEDIILIVKNYGKNSSHYPKIQ
jgi:hypothetical protein